MSTRILILKDGVITPSRSSTDINNIKNSLGLVDLTTNQSIGGVKTFSGGLALPSSAGTSVSSIWRNVDNLEYKDSSNVTKILLNSAGNLSNLSNKQTALNNLVGTQTANRVLRSNGINTLLAQVDLTTDVTGILPIANGGTGSTTQNFVDLTTNQTIGGIKTLSSPLVISNTTASTSTTTGALIVTGGQAIQGNLWVAGSINQNINYTFKGGSASNQSITANTWTKVLLTSELSDSNNQYNNTNSRLIANTTEIWRITLYISFRLTTNTRVLLSVWKNGAEIGGISRVMDDVLITGDSGRSFNILEFPLLATDYLEVYCYCVNAVTVLGEGSFNSVFWSGKRIN